MSLEHSLEVHGRGEVGTGYWWNLYIWKFEMAEWLVHRGPANAPCGISSGEVDPHMQKIAETQRVASHSWPRELMEPRG